MKSQPLLIMAAFFLVLAVGGAVLLHVTGTPVSLITSIIAATAPIVGIVATVHGRVFSQDHAEKLVTQALETEAPASPVETKAMAAAIVGSPP